jgi:hypothetical protein
MRPPPFLVSDAIDPGDRAELHIFCFFQDRDEVTAFPKYIHKIMRLLLSPSKICIFGEYDGPGNHRKKEEK